MSRSEYYTVIENRALCEGIFEMRLSGNAEDFSAPGQFMDIALDGLFLRRPISIADITGEGPVIIYRVVGEGTKRLSVMKRADGFNALTGLGNGFTVTDAKRPSVIGGGVGIPPLYFLTRRLIEAGQSPVVALGFADKAGEFYVDRFEALGARVRVATLDGSLGIKGTVIDALSGDADHFYACGPLPMLKALCESISAEGQLSLEAKMGCGFGACMGCSIMTKNGAKRVCKDGPVFLKSEMLWKEP